MSTTLHLSRTTFIVPILNPTYNIYIYTRYNTKDIVIQI